MGKGTILSGGSAGQYNVRLDFDVTRLTAEIAKINTLISEIDVTTLPALELALLEAQNAKNSALTAVDLAIEAFRAGTGTLEQVEKKQVALVAAANAVDRAQLAVDNTIGRKLALEKRRTGLQAVPVSENVSAWCADLTENLTGPVGTIEIPGQRAGVPVLIRPGYSGAAYSAARDGQLQPVKSSTPAAAFVNYALLPGWQKWKPLYRIGTISALNQSANTCTVTLDAARSTAQNLNVNAQSVYSDVTISYMTCNARAFEDGDRVVVEFIGQDYTQPRVIGFESEPRSCIWEPWGAALTAHHPWSFPYPPSAGFTYSTDPYFEVSSVASDGPKEFRIVTAVDLPTSRDNNELIRAIPGRVIEHRSEILQGGSSLVGQILITAVDDPELPESSNSLAYRAINFSAAMPAIEVLDLINDVNVPQNYYVFDVGIWVGKNPTPTPVALQFRNTRIDFYDQ